MKYSKDSLLVNRRNLFSIILAFLVCCTSFIPITAPNQALAAGSNADKYYNPIKNTANDPWVMYKDNYYYYIESWTGEFRFGNRLIKT
jgi:hypothetical protein